MISRNEVLVDEENPVASFLPTERAGVRIALAAAQDNSVLSVSLQDLHGGLTGQRYQGSSQRDFGQEFTDRVDVNKSAAQFVVYQIFNPNPYDRPDRSTVVLEIGWDAAASAVKVIGYSVVLPLGG